jgi:hypothetical protein
MPFLWLVQYELFVRVFMSLLSISLRFAAAASGVGFDKKQAKFCP